MTENIFPYELPANWQWTKWGQCGKFIAGSGFKKEYQGLKNFEIPFYKVGSLKFSDSKGYIQDKANTINKNILKILKAQLIPKDSLLFAKIGEAIKLNRRALSDIPCCIDNNLMAFVSEKILPRYVYYWSLNIDLYIYTNATTVPAIRKRDLEKIPIPLPPLDEQKRIVEVIESLFSKLDAAKSIVQKIFDGYELRRAAILHKAFTGELTKNFRAKNNLSLDDWQQKKLGDVLKLSTQKTNSFNENLKYVGLENISKDSGKITFQSAKNIKSTKNIFHSSDLLYGKLRPYLNKHGIPNFDGVCSTDILVLNANELSANEFINYFFYLPKFVEYAVSNSKGINLPRVSAQIILNYEINLPPIDEQKEVVRILDSLIEKETRTKDFAEKILSEIELLKKTILARAFRGKLLK